MQICDVELPVEFLLLLLCLFVLVPHSSTTSHSWLGAASALVQSATAFLRVVALHHLLDSIEIIVADFLVHGLGRSAMLNPTQFLIQSVLGAEDVIGHFVTESTLLHLMLGKLLLDLF